MDMAHFLKLITLACRHMDFSFLKLNTWAKIVGKYMKSELKLFSIGTWLGDHSWMIVTLGINILHTFSNEALLLFIECVHIFESDSTVKVKK